jgi:hypothetical protein
MKRALAVAAFVVGAVIVADAIAHRAARATLDDDVFTSREADVRMLAPRGWRVSDVPSYPGVLLWMNRSKPPGQMLLTVEDISPSSRACWPAECGHNANVPDFVCVLGSRLRAAGFEIGPVEDGRWFDYQAGKSATRFLRQGVVVLGHHAFTLILAAPTANDRATHARAFDRALRSVRPLSAGGEALGAADLPDDEATDGGRIAVGATGDAGTTGDGGTTGATGATGSTDAGASVVMDALTATVVPGDGGSGPTLAPLDARPAPADAGVQVIESVPPCKVAAPAPPPAPARP